MTQLLGYPFGVATCVVEASDPPASLDLDAADEWRVLITWRGTPCRYLALPCPGATSGPGTVDAAIVRHADGMAAWEQLVDRLRTRMGVPDRQPDTPSCSVVLCTHRRPRYVADVLDALRRLDPPADEIVVVDNDPGEHDCRAEAQRAGARYIREDRPGLDRARNAGLRAASGALVAFTDDDCVPATGWLRPLPELFADPAVAAVTGPAFAYTLDTPAQVRFEDQGGHRRGLQRRTFDWRTLTPIAATRAGAGLNMVFRRSVLEELGEVFPPELDAGTPTQSGGDMYALYKLLRAGHRIVYEPAAYVLHQHRTDSRSLHRTIQGYGIGLSAVLTKLAVEERELAGPTVWYWLWWLYLDAARRRLAGQADAVDMRIGWDYLAGGLLGPAKWWRSRKRFGRDDRRPPPVSPSAGRTAASMSSQPNERSLAATWGLRAEPAVSAVIAVTRPGEETRCLEALSRQSEGIGRLEAIVVGGGRRQGASTVGPLAVRWVQADPANGVRNTGAREARGDLLLFLDADAMPARDCVRSHLDRHGRAERARLVVGYSSPAPIHLGLASLWEAGRRQEHFARKRLAAAMTFADVRSSNVSLRRDTFDELGGFDAAFERVDREAWELGVRALRAGVEVAYEPTAEVAEAFRLDTRNALETAGLEGNGDALLEARYPLVSASLPVAPAAPAPHRRPLSWACDLLVCGPRADRATAAALDGLERLRARRLWLRLFELARLGAYRRGALSAGGRRPAAACRVEALRVELDSDEPIPRPAIAPPRVELALHGEPIGRLMPTGGQWHAYLADEAAVVVADRLDALPLERPPAFEETAEGGDLSGSAVVFGPARRPGDDVHREELAAAGAAVELLDGEAEQQWAALDSGIRASAAEIVALALPGSAPTPAWLAGARLALEGERVALAVGAGLAAGSPPQILFLGARRSLRAPYPILGRPAQYLLVRRELYAAMGGFDLAATRFGDHAVVLDLMDRALEAGWVIAYRDVPGLEPVEVSRRTARRAAWRRHHARGGLTLRRARRTGGMRGAVWLARYALLPQALNVLWALRSDDRSAIQAAGAAAAFFSGCLRAAADRLDRGPTEAVRASSAPTRRGRRVR